jgi:hypothetical protein
MLCRRSPTPPRAMASEFGGRAEPDRLPRSTGVHVRSPTATPDPRARSPIVQVHPNSTSPERHSFQLETQPLFFAFLPRQGDPASRRDHAVPRKPDSRMQRPNGQARPAREAPRGGDLAVRDHLPPRHESNHATESSERRQTFLPGPESPPTIRPSSRASPGEPDGANWNLTPTERRTREGRPRPRRASRTSCAGARVAPLRRARRPRPSNRTFVKASHAPTMVVRVSLGCPPSSVDGVRGLASHWRDLNPRPADYESAALPG